MSLVSVLIPNWNGAYHTIECLDSLLAQDYGSANLEVVIVDNGSQDGSLEEIEKKFNTIGSMFSRYALIKFDQNKGIASAYNAAYEKVSQDAFAVLRLDNDVILPRHAVTTLVNKLLEHSDSAIVGCRIITGDNSAKKWGHFGAVFIKWGSAKARIMYPDSDVNCDGVCGCAMFIRKDALSGLDYFFNPKSFLANELDLCQRLKALNWKIVYTPAVEIFHKGARSSTRICDFIELETLKENLIFYYRFSHGFSRLNFIIYTLIWSLVKLILGNSAPLEAIVIVARDFFTARITKE